MKSILIRYQVILYFCILSVFIILILPIGSISLTSTYKYGSENDDPQSYNLNVPWVLYAHEETSSSFYTEIIFASEDTHRKLDFIATIARSAIVAVPLVTLILLAAIWRHLSRDLKYRLVLLVIASTCVYILVMALFGPPLITSPLYSGIVINEVEYKWVTLLLILSYLLLGIGSGIYFFRKTREFDNANAS
jgi:hypothetical protein